MDMAHNIMRVDSMNDRYFTETMIDLNLNLNEDIDFDFFDNIETPTKELDSKKTNSLSTSLLRSCSPQPFEDDDDVQVNHYPLRYNVRSSKDISSSVAIKDINASSDSIEEPLSTGTENDDKFMDNFGEYEILQKSEDVSVKLNNSASAHNITASCVHPLAIERSSQMVSHHTKHSSNEDILESKQYVMEENDVLSNDSFKIDDKPLANSSREDEVDITFSKISSLPPAPVMTCSTSIGEGPSLSRINKNDTVLMKCGENLEGAADTSNESLDGNGCVKFRKYYEDASSKYRGSLKAEGSFSGYDSDDGCPFEGSDSDELLIGVHTLSIIPRENEDSLPCNPTISEQTGKAEENKLIHSTSCQKAAITARSSSGYSSASCKAHNCMIHRRTTSMVDSRQSSKMKMHSPDMNELINSFRKMKSSPQVSFADKYSISTQRPRRNMSFSKEEFKRIERENAILLNKIVLQQRARPTVVHKYERRVTSNEINRVRQSKKIEYDNEILLRKIQDVKRKSTLSAQSSRCISQASTSQF